MSFKVESPGGDHEMTPFSRAPGGVFRLARILCCGTFSPVGRSRRRLTGFSEGGDEMSALKILAIVLIVAGIAGLLYGKFSYTKETHDIKLGPLEMSLAEKQTVNVPAWAGVAAIVCGGALLLYGSKKS